MPDEYISRQAAISAILGEQPDAHYPGWYASILMRLPAADVAPVVHGRWIYHDDGVFVCGECGNAESNDSYYCRYCGARMDGAAE